MAAPPLSLFALHIPAGGEVVYPEVSFSKDFTISSITFSDELPDGAKPKRSLVKVHHTPIPEDEESDDDEYFEDDDDEDDDDDDEDEVADAAKANGNGKPAAAKKLALGDHSVDVSSDEIDPIPEEETHTICALVPGQQETVTGLNVHCAAEDMPGFSVTGPYAVDLIGVYTANPVGMNQEPDSDEEDSDEEIDSDIYGENSDDDEDEELYFEDEDDDDEPMDPVLAGLLNPEDSGEEGAIEDPSRFKVIKDGKTSKKADKAANGKKRGADAAGLDADASMASAVSSAPSAADGDDLTRNQRKRLNQKLKAKTEAGTAAAVGDESTASTASAKAKKQVSFKDKEAAAAVETTAKAAAAGSKKEKAAAAAPAVEKKKEAKAAAAPAKAAASKKITTPTGLIIEDVKVGTGVQAKPGQRVGMRYIGKTKEGKQFDANTSGKPFYFKLGRGEVIKGWDEGVKGMTIGSERRLTCPPSLAYGSQRLPGIPANSTLVFDVKLVDIK